MVRACVYLFLRYFNLLIPPERRKRKSLKHYSVRLSVYRWHQTEWPVSVFVGVCVWVCAYIVVWFVFFCVVFIFVLLKFIQVHRNDPTNVSMQIILNWWTVMIPAFQWLDWSVDSECFVDQLLCVCCVCAQIILFQKKKIRIVLLRSSCNSIEIFLLLVTFVHTAIDNILFIRAEPSRAVAISHISNNGRIQTIWFFFWVWARGIVGISIVSLLNLIAKYSSALGSTKFQKLYVEMECEWHKYTHTHTQRRYINLFGVLFRTEWNERAR